MRNKKKTIHFDWTHFILVCFLFVGLKFFIFIIIIWGNKEKKYDYVPVTNERDYIIKINCQCILLKQIHRPLFSLFHNHNLETMIMISTERRRVEWNEKNPELWRIIKIRESKWKIIFRSTMSVSNKKKQVCLFLNNLWRISIAHFLSLIIVCETRTKNDMNDVTKKKR